jgi:hypothetical protein
MVTLLLLLAFSMSPDIDPPPSQKVWIDNHEIWMQTSAGPRRVVYDAAANYLVAVSESGDKVAYAVPDGKPVPDGAKSSMLVVMVTSDGQSLGRFTPEDPYFDALEWIDNDRLGVMTCGHANCIYWVVDATTGQTLHKYFGGFDFLWSHDRRYVARRALGPITREDEKGAPFESDDLSSLMFNDDRKDVYPPQDPKTRRPYQRVLGYLTWSPDDEWISFPETEYPSYDSYVVLVSPKGEVLRESLPVDVEYNAKIIWTDANHFQITASKRMFYFTVESGKLREVAAPALH